MRSRVYWPVAAFLTVLTACTREPLEFADWTIPIPEGTPVIEYAAVPMTERTERIELVRDLVIGRSGDDPNYLFHLQEAWQQLTVDGGGRIYVVDGRNYRIQVFDDEGRFVRTIGQRGQGPGEFGRPPWAIAVAGDRVAVSYPNADRIDEWSSSGDFLGIRHLGSSARISKLAGTSSGQLIAGYIINSGEDRWEETVGVARVPYGEDEGYTYVEKIDPPLPLAFSPQFGQEAPPLALIGLYRPAFAATAGGDLYLTPSDEYQVLALEVTGEPRWALRVAWQRRQPTERDISAYLHGLRELGATPEEREWFSQRRRDQIGVLGPWPALAEINVDGRGHLYVFPEVTRFPGTYDEGPVDVYSAEGEHLFSGLIHTKPITTGRLAFALALPSMPRRASWGAAHGDCVYTIEEDEDSGEAVVVRYRLVEPF
jgi:hypothetical protein